MKKKLTWLGTTSAASDQALRGRITRRLENDPGLWLRGQRGTMIVVEAQRGYVRLSGYVRTVLDRRRAEMLARQLGAHGVDNQLRVDPPAGAQQHE